MHLQVKKPQNGTIKVLRNKQATTNVSLIFLNVRMLKELHRHFLKGFKPTRKIQHLETPKSNGNKVTTQRKSKEKVRLILLKIKVQETRYVLCLYRWKCIE